jgi:hypothetical protein
MALTSPARLPCLSPKRLAARVGAQVLRGPESEPVRPAQRKPRRVGTGLGGSPRGLKLLQQVKAPRCSSQRPTKHPSPQRWPRPLNLHRRRLGGELGSGGGSRTPTVAAHQLPRSPLVSAGSGACPAPAGEQAFVCTQGLELSRWPSEGRFRAPDRAARARYADENARPDVGRVNAFDKEDHPT